MEAWLKCVWKASLSLETGESNDGIINTARSRFYPPEKTCSFRICQDYISNHFHKRVRLPYNNLSFQKFTMDYSIFTNYSQFDSERAYFCNTSIAIGSVIYDTYIVYIILIYSNVEHCKFTQNYKSD